MRPFMRRIVFCGIAILYVGALFAGEIWHTTLTPAVTTVAASSTNSTAGTSQELLFAQRPCRIWVTASGVAATTNGSLVVKFSTAASTNQWDTANLSEVKVTMSSLGATTNTYSTWFETAGIRYIRVGQIENTFVGVVSNIAIRISAPQ